MGQRQYARLRVGVDLDRTVTMLSPSEDGQAEKEITMKRAIWLWMVICLAFLPSTTWAGARVVDGTPQDSGAWEDDGATLSTDRDVETSGSVTVGGTVTAPTAKFTTGAGAGKYWTSDADGDGSWTTASGTGDILADGSVPFTGDQDFGGNYATGLQNIADLAGSGPGYWFDGEGSTAITVADTAQLEFENELSTVVVLRRDAASGDTYETIAVKDGNTDDQADWLSYTPGDSELFYELGSGSGVQRFVIDYTFTNGENVILAAIAEYDGSSDTTVSFYENGGLSNSDTETFQLNTTGGGDDFHIGKYKTDAYRWRGSIYSLKRFNLALDYTDPVDQAIISGGAVPYQYQGASQTAANEYTFDADVSALSLSQDDETSTWTHDTDHGVLAVTGAGTSDVHPRIHNTTLTPYPTVGKRYRLSFDYTVNSGTCVLSALLFDDSTTTAMAQTLSGSGTFYYNWAAAHTNADNDIGFFFDGTNAFNVSIDNVTVTQIGCVAQYEPDGIGHSQWIDRSGNELHGDVSGAIAHNLPANHTEKYVDLTVTGDTSFTLPAGYMITAITTEETAGNAVGGGIDVGTTNGGAEVVAAHAVSASTAALCALVAGANYNLTGADDTIYITDADGTGWDSASVEIRVQMQRIDMD